MATANSTIGYTTKNSISLDIDLEEAEDIVLWFFSIQSKIGAMNDST